MKARYNEDYFQLVINTSTLNPDHQYYTFSTTVGSLDEANRILNDLGYESIPTSDTFYTLIKKAKS